MFFMGGLPVAGNPALTSLFILRLRFAFLFCKTPATPLALSITLGIGLTGGIMPAIVDCRKRSIMFSSVASFGFSDINFSR